MMQAYFSPCADIRGSGFVVPRATRCLLCLLTIPCGAGLLSNLATLYKEDGNYHSAAYFLGLAIIQHNGASSPALTSLEKQQQACLKLAKEPPATTQTPRCV